MTLAGMVDVEAIERRADGLIEAHEVLMLDLIRMRKKHHLTQAEVAERMGVSQPTVAAFERYDSNPTLSTIRRYALAVEARLIESVIDDCCDESQVTERFLSAVQQPATVRYAPARRAVTWDMHWTGGEAQVFVAAR